MIKRMTDFLIALVGLLLLSPVLILAMVIVWLQDFHSPLYIAPRVGIRGKLFKMVKLRSMIINADKSGVDSTSASDPRITSVGRFIRKYKLDEFTQLWNVLKGEMSLVGPRPNVQRDVDGYTEIEKELLNVRPGITDISSIVFSDENEILKNSTDPDLDYSQLIRPWKSRLGILYINNQSFKLDIKLILCTLMAIYSREKALYKVSKLLAEINADEKLREISLRQTKLIPHPPPGTDQIVTRG